MNNISKSNLIDLDSIFGNPFATKQSKVNENEYVNFFKIF